MGFGVHIHVRRGADRGEGIAQGGFGGGAVIDHDSNIHPITAVVELGLGGGMVLVEWDIEKAGGRVGGTDTANAGAGDGDGVLDIKGVCGEVVRQGQDFIRIVGIGRGIIGAGGNKVPGGDTELVQAEDSGGLDVKFVCLSEVINYQSSTVS